MRRFSAAAFFCGLLFPCHAGAATYLDVATGLDYSEGRYGRADDTRILTLPLAMRLQMDKLRLEASTSYLSIKSPGTYTGSGVVGGGTVVTNSGLGDLTLGGAWMLQAATVDLPSFELAGSIKVPTASKNLGTGKFDFGVQANVAHWLSQSTMLFGSFGYQWLSDFSIYNLQSGISASAGTNFRFGDSINVGFSSGFRQPYSPGIGNMHTLSPYLMWGFKPNWRVSLYAQKGFTRASPRIGGGMRLIYYQ